MTTSRYERVIRISTTSTTAVIGSRMLKPDSPNVTSSAMRICSVPYADDEMQSLDSTPSATFLDSFSSVSFAVTSGGPSSTRLMR